MLLVSGMGAGCGDSGSSAGTESGTESETGAETTDSSGETSDAESSSESGETGASSCEETPPQTPGPFPQAGLERNDFNLWGHEGVPFTLRGQVLDENCEALVGAQVLLWHATPSPPGVAPATPEADPAYSSAVYDHEAQAGQSTPDGTPVPTGEQMYYGWTSTDESGSYSFATLRPGWYLNGGNYRPAHLHVRIFVDGVESLTTQLYFPDDPFNELDSIQVNACDNESCFVEYENEDGSEARFDLHVDISAGSIAARGLELPSY
jgi:protocatechuate 3,4-dioxygenase beta subunit